MLTLDKNIPGEPLLLHDEPIYLKDKIIGRTTSGNYSFCFNKNISYGYIKTEFESELNQNDIFIEVEKEKYPAKVLKRALNNKNIKET